LIFAEVMSDMELGHFQLVTSFPRHVFSEHQSSLKDIGLLQKELLVVENLEEE